MQTRSNPLDQMQEARAILDRVRRSLLEIDPTIADDETLYFDMLDGEGGDAMDILRAAMRAGIEAESFADSMNARLEVLAARRNRFVRRSEVLKTGVYSAMHALGLLRLVAPDFVVSFQRGQRGVRITDEAALPEAFVKVERTPMKKQIATALRNGGIIPGAELSNAEPSPRVRLT